MVRVTRWIAKFMHWWLVLAVCLVAGIKCLQNKLGKFYLRLTVPENAAILAGKA